MAASVAPVVFDSEWGLMFEVTETALDDAAFSDLSKKANYLVYQCRQVQDRQAGNCFEGGY